MKGKLLMKISAVISVVMLFLIGGVGNVSAQSDLGTAGSGRTDAGTGINIESTVKRKSRPKATRTTPKRTVPTKKTALAYEQEGDKYFTQKDYDSALIAYQNAVRLNPKSLKSHYRIGWIYNDFQEYSKALLALDKALVINSSEYLIYLEKGYAHRRLDQTNAALSALKQCITLNPKADIALFELGALYNDLKMYNDAVTYLRQSIYYRPDYAEAYEELGVSLRRLGRNSEAITAFNKAISLDPGDSGGYMGLGDVYYYGTKEYQKAINAYLNGLQLDDDNYIATYNVGWSYNELGNYNEAIRWMNQTAKIKPDYYSAYVEMGYAYYKLNQDTQSINAYQKALQYKPDYANAHLGIADVYYENLKNYQLAADNYRKGLMYKSNDITAMYRLSWCYNHFGRYQEAIDWLVRAKQLKPEIAVLHIELGYSYMMLKRFNDAAVSLRQALAINKDSQLARYYLGQVYYYGGNRNAAIAEYRELQRLNSQYAPKLLDIINGK